LVGPFNIANLQVRKVGLPPLKYGNSQLAMHKSASDLLEPKSYSKLRRGQAALPNLQIAAT
ncbi:MAG: hypothetical protein ACREBC_25890, partial [Pyrinomonadaceae bacterium]